jgi:hypothetical protein
LADLAGINTSHNGGSFTKRLPVEKSGRQPRIKFTYGQREEKVKGGKPAQRTAQRQFSGVFSQVRERNLQSMSSQSRQKSLKKKHFDVSLVILCDVMAVQGL